MSKEELAKELEEIGFNLRNSLNMPRYEFLEDCKEEIFWAVVVKEFLSYLREQGVV